MQLILVFTVILMQMVLINPGEVVKVEGAPGVDAFMDAEKLPVLIRDEGVAAVRAYKAERRCDNLAGDKGLPTDFALELPIAAIIIVEIVVRCPTKRTEGIFRDGFTIAALNGSDGFAVLPEIVFKEKLPVLFDERLEEREGSVVNFWYLGEWEPSKAHCLSGIYLQIKFRSQQIVLYCS